MSKMHNPPHPGAILREDVLPALGLNVMQGAEQLGVARREKQQDQGKACCERTYCGMRD